MLARNVDVKRLVVTALLLGVPWLSQAKTDPAKEKANLAAAFKKLVDKVDAARKPGPFTASACLSAADDFVGFGKSNKSAEGYFNAAVLYEECGDAVKADHAYRDALSVNPNFAPSHVNIGEMLYKAGNLTGAQGEFDTALRLDPKNVQAYNDVALMTFERARQGSDKAAYADAIGKLRRALAIDSDSIQAYSLLALIYFQLAESDRAKLDLAALVCKQAKEVNDKYARAHQPEAQERDRGAQGVSHGGGAGPEVHRGQPEHWRDHAVGARLHLGGEVVQGGAGCAAAQPAAVV